MTKEQALLRLQAQCSRSEYCTGQIYEKLTRWAAKGIFCSEDNEWVINLLIADKFVDDYRFACAYTRDKFKISGWGKRKIEYQLRRLRVPTTIINMAVQENCINSTKTNDMLLKLVERKWNSLKKEELPAQKKIKVLRFAIGRGFEYDEIMAALLSVYNFDK
ncbi:MAG: regulatory protein RecX [Bacteroidales bacterium]